MENALDRLLAANQEFYDAFDRRDIAAVEALWATAHPCSCVHPGWDVVTGRDEVLASWRNILANPAAPRIQCRNPYPLFHGDFAAVICHEVLADGVLVATNLFAEEDGAWRLVHHHSGTVMALPGRRASNAVH
jgi:ketosteroid isomerase-like protein